MAHNSRNDPPGPSFEHNFSHDTTTRSPSLLCCILAARSPGTDGIATATMEGIVQMDDISQETEDLAIGTTEGDSNKSRICLYMYTFCK